MLPGVRHCLAFGAETEGFFFLLPGAFGGDSALVAVLSWLGKVPLGLCPGAAGREQPQGRNCWRQVHGTGRN